LTKENLESHKKLISDLLQLVNEKKDEIYLLTSENDILNSELNFWVYGIEHLKINPKMREKFKEVNVTSIAENVNEEISHKGISSLEKALLVNADRYLICSGQRNYFYDQKKYYTDEIERMTGLYQKNYLQKREYKKWLKDKSDEFTKNKELYEHELNKLREKIGCEKHNIGTQTEVDIMGFRKMVRNHDLVVFQKRITQNKLTEFIEKIQYCYSKNKPISKRSIISLIPELYSEKIDLDLKYELAGVNKMLMDDFFYKYFKDKFKLNKIIKKNCEQTILAVVKFSNEDPRIDLLRKFLGIGEGKIRREVLDVYLALIKSN
jgi:hypothetical protein